MEVGFACPECGFEVSVTGLTAGRRVRCVRCTTLVEIPYLPRASLHTIQRRRKGPSWTTWALLGAAIVVIVVGAVGVSVVVSRLRSSRHQRIDALIAASQREQRAGRPDLALAETDQAIALAASVGDLPAGRLDSLRTERDALARLDVRQRLSELAAAEPNDAAAASYRALAERCQGDPSLAGLKEEVGAALTSVMTRRADAVLDLARADLNAGRPLAALAACERLADPGMLPVGEDGVRLSRQTRDLAGRIIEEAGVIVEHPRCLQTRIKTPSEYDQRLRPLLSEALLRRDYLAQPTTSPFRDLWDQKAGYRMRVEVAENQNLLYLQTPNRAAEIAVKLVLVRGGTALWQEHMTARPREPLPNVSTLERRQFALSTRRDPAIERRLFDDAEASLLEQVDARLRKLPGRARTGP